MINLGISLLLPLTVGIDLQVQPSESSTGLDVASSVHNLGSLIGDHESDTNPTGTITIPGLWGGSGNQEIPIELTSGTYVFGTSTPSGGLSVEPFDAQGIAVIHDLSLNILNGSSIPVTLTVTLLYDSFHTENPTSIFPGGVPIELPLAEVDLQSCLIEQVESVTGLLDQINKNTYTIQAAVPVTVTMEATYQGQPVPLAPVPALIAISGELQYTAAGPRLEMSVAIDEAETVDLPGDQPLPAVPLPLPTIVPPGGVANVLLTLVPQSTSISLLLEGTVIATGEPETPPCDVTGDGFIDANDILAVLDQWGYCPGCPADTDGDDLVDVNDILNVLECWPP